MAKRGIWDTLHREGLREVVSEAIRAVLWPVLLAVGGGALTVLSALVSPVPLPYLITASVIVFASILWAALQVSYLQERLRVSHRLVLNDVFFGRGYERGTDDSVLLTSVQLGILVLNTAGFPMNCRVSDIRTTFEGRVLQNKELRDREFILYPGKPELYRDASIIFDPGIPVLAGQRHQGSLYFKVEYGKGKKFSHSIEHDIEIEAIAQEDPSQFNFFWVYRQRQGLQ